MKPTTATFFDLVRSQIPLVEARMRSAPDRHHPQLSLAIDHLLASGGKRLRPTLTLLTARMLGTDEDKAIGLAAAIEMLHTATLVHDDLIDGSLMRRGLPTLNANLTPGATVLTGDYIFARAAHLAASIGSLPLMEHFARTLMTIVNGEIIQLFREQSGDDRQDYFDRIYAKTASLFELATMGSAILRQANQEIIEAMRRFGYQTGIAFQIVDDVLDFAGDEAQVGKPLGSDLRHGLLTLPTLLYLDGRPEGASLAEAILAGSLSVAELNDLVGAIRTSDAVERALSEARNAIAAGETQLEGMPDGPERAGLRQLAHYVVDRSV
ncbi:MAG TPA: polyprenyl synthetase family protein [Anaerolineales bacterium]|nr:polyprenyl synthetase family protein [Anaerolineales bacterium]